MIFRFSLNMFMMFCTLLISKSGYSHSISDLALEDLGLSRFDFPKDQTQFITIALPQLGKNKVQFLRSFFAREFSNFDAEINRLHFLQIDNPAEKSTAESLIRTLTSTQLAGLKICDEWMANFPQSYAAHWFCGALWESAAWKARTESSIGQVSTARLTQMKSRLIKSNQILEKSLSMTPKPVEAITRLASNHFLLGDHWKAKEYIDRGLKMSISYNRIYTVNASFSTSEWGGSAEEVEAVLANAKKNNVDKNTLAYIKDYYLARPWKSEIPGYEATYWQKMISEEPTFDRYLGFIQYFARLSNWRDLYPVADEMIKKYPDSGEAYYWRARASESFGQIQAAIKDFKTSAAMGNELAIEDLIRANIQGKLGLPAKNLAGLADICLFGAQIGSASGMNCLASAYLEGSLSPHIARDFQKALVWHLLAARAGHLNSQHDLGWLLLSGQVPNMATEKAKTFGVFWLRQSAEQGHPYAQLKLKSRGFDVVEVESKIWNSKFFRYVGIPLSVFLGVLITLLIFKNDTPAKREGVLYILEYGSAAKIMVGFLFMASLFVVYAASQARLSQLTMAIGVATSFMVFVLFLFYQVFLVKLSYNDNFIYLKSPFAGDLQFSWSDIVEIGYSQIFHCFYLKSSSGKYLWIPEYLRGYKELGRFLDQKNICPYLKNDV